MGGEVGSDIAVFVDIVGGHILRELAELIAKIRACLACFASHREPLVFTFLVVL